MIEYKEFARILDGADHNPSFKEDAYAVFTSGKVKTFYPNNPGYYKYLINGKEGFIGRSVHDGIQSNYFDINQRFDIDNT